MAGSLFDQLKKTGLVDAKSAKKAQKSAQNRARQQRKGQLDDSAERERQAALEAERQAQIERDRALNKQRQAEAEKKALSAQVKQIVEMNALRFDHPESVYRFQDDKLVKEVQLDEKARKALVKGQLAIARYESSYRVIPATAANKIAERVPEYIVVNNQEAAQQAAQDEVPSDDDPYADFQVPDDLMW